MYGGRGEGVRKERAGSGRIGKMTTYCTIFCNRKRAKRRELSKRWREPRLIKGYGKPKV